MVVWMSLVTWSALLFQTSSIGMFSLSLASSLIHEHTRLFQIFRTIPSLAHFSTSTRMVDTRSEDPVPIDYVNDVYQSKTINPSSMARYNHLPAFPNNDITLMEGHLLANVPGKNDPYIVAFLFTAHVFFSTSGASVGSRSGTTTTRWLDRVRTSTVERIFVSGRVQPVDE
jgi:hypothetical protein